MKKMSVIILVLIAITLLVMTGCTRSATRAPRAVPTDEGVIPFPESTQSQILEDILAATQTAQAQESSASNKEPTDAPATGEVNPPRRPLRNPQPSRRRKPNPVPSPPPRQEHHPLTPFSRMNSPSASPAASM